MPLTHNRASLVVYGDADDNMFSYFLIRGFFFSITTTSSSLYEMKRKLMSPFQHILFACRQISTCFGPTGRARDQNGTDTEPMVVSTAV
jgi:hypothetical protein